MLAFNRLRPPSGVQLFLVASVVLLVGRPAHAQSTGASVGGAITDDTGAALPGVTVTITNRSNGLVQTVVTGSEGRYRAVALQPAPYDISADLPGFARIKRDSR